MARGGLYSEGMAVMHFQEVPDGSVWSEDMCIQVEEARVLWSGHMGSALPELFSSEVMVGGRLG